LNRGEVSFEPFGPQRREEGALGEQ